MSLETLFQLNLFNKSVFFFYKQINVLLKTSWPVLLTKVRSQIKQTLNSSNNLGLEEISMLWFLCDGNFLISVWCFWMTSFWIRWKFREGLDVRGAEVVLGDLISSCQHIMYDIHVTLPQAVHCLQLNAGVCCGPHTHSRVTQQLHRAIQYPLLAVGPSHGVRLLFLAQLRETC